MERRNNYQLQVEQAKRYFLKYDQQALIEKLKLEHDADFLYATMLSLLYRLNRKTGALERLEGDTWINAESHGEYMTLLDLICDSRPDRHLSFRFQNMSTFGKVFHSSLLESRDPFADRIQQNPEGFRRACEALNGTPEKLGDISYAIEVFDGLCICLQFWEADEDFPPQVVWFWDENALMYLKYETMWFAVGMLKQRIAEKMKTLTE